MEQQRVLVTGDTGLLGAHVVADLRARGHEVRLLARDATRDVAAVSRAVQGCTALVHSQEDPAEVAGTTTVLKAGIGRGCDPIVYVAVPRTASEAIARRLQDAGAPLTILYPGAVLGPDDPGLSPENRRLRDLLRGDSPMWPAGSRYLTDVRDLARAVGELMTPGAGPHRYLVPAHLLPVEQAAAEQPRPDYPALPGLEPRPLAVTLSDTVAWLRAAGQLTAAQAASAVGREPFLPG